MAFDVPYPVDYGGVFDVFYKLDALQRAGIQIHLHCFEYGRGRQPELEKYCAEVHYYPRVIKPTAFLNGIPYIVSSRSHHKLPERLNADNYPVFMEGIHCTWFLYNHEIDSQRCHVRLMNVEHIYYAHLAGFEKDWLRKTYYRKEADWLKKYEKMLVNRGKFYAIGENDLKYFQTILGYSNIVHLPLFLKEQRVYRHNGKGNYCLYHGNLSVPENVYAVRWLVKHVASALPGVHFLFAGKNPASELVGLAEMASNIRIIANPAASEMEQLLVNAQIHLLPSFNKTGIKLKLIEALYFGRFCIVNKAGADGDDLQSCCLLAEDPEEFINHIRNHMDREVPEETYSHREHVLTSLFDNDRNAQFLIRSIWPA